jgi:hypothetical protein
MIAKPLLLAALIFAIPGLALADELDCTEMENVVREILVDSMQIPQYLSLDTTRAANVTFEIRSPHPETKERLETYCAATVKLRTEEFAKAEARSADVRDPQAPENISASASLAPYRAFPDGFKVLYKLELTDNSKNWLVTLLNDPPTDHICALSNLDRYMGFGRQRCLSR